MKIVVPPPNISTSAPFANDKLKREPVATALTNLVQSLDDSTVITIDAPWGEGKTTFAKMWSALLKDKGCRCIYIDAFANDYLDDAFIVIVGEIVSYVKETYSVGDPIHSAAESLLKKASHAGVKLLSFGAKIGLKAATLGVLKNEDFRDLEEIKEAVTSDSFDFASNMFETKLREHKADVASIEEFRKDLSDFALQIKKDTSYPLILIIDELDRCRPTYAVDFIEKIKHLFSVKNVVFTLILNKQQLAAAVSSIYGEGIDSFTYLQKFFTLEMSLPKNSDGSDNDYRTFCNHIYKELKIDSGNEMNTIQSAMICLTELFSLSLRDIEKCYSQVSLFYGAKACSYHLTPLIPLLAIAKTKFPESYTILRSGARLDQIESTEMYQTLIKNISFLKKHRIEKIISILHFCTMPEENYKQIDPQDKDVTRYEEYLWNLDRNEIIPALSKRLDMFNIVTSS